MGGILDEVRALGADIAVVGNGTVEQARAFQEEQRVRMPLFTDPGRRTYEALGMVRGAGKTLGLASLAHGARAFKAGYRQGALQGDPWQQGGVFLVLPDGSTPYAFRGGEAGDHPDPRALVAALRAVSPSRGTP